MATVYRLADPLQPPRKRQGLTVAQRAFIHPAIRVSELLKALRHGPLSIGEISEVIGSSRDSARLWALELEAQALVVRRRRARQPTKKGFAPVEFVLAPEWGGHD